MQDDTTFPQVEALTRTLKELLRARDLYQSVIAKNLNVTQRTVTRWLSGQGLTVQVLESLCGLLGITFFELCEAVLDDPQVRPRFLGAERERALLQDPQLTLVFNLITRGWTPQEIQRACNLSEPVLVENLVRLDKLRLIDLLPGNKVRLLVSKKISWTQTSELGRAFIRGMNDTFLKIDFTASETIWGFALCNLSPDELENMRKKTNDFTRDIQASADDNRNLHKEERSWYATLVAIRPFDPTGGVKAQAGTVESP